MFNGMNGLEILKNWPRFEDGEPVRIGDVAVLADNEPHEVESMEFFADKSCKLKGKGTPWMDTIFKGQVAKRPAPKALDADGVEIRVGDTVYEVKTGDKFVVETIYHGMTEPDFPEHTVRCHKPSDITAHMFAPDMLTHRAPFLAVDDKPLLKGETVWSVYSGTRYTVEEIEDGPIPIKCRSEMGSTVSLHPSQLTHEQPDSWELLEADCSMNTGVYTRERMGIDVDKVPAKESRRIDMMRDLVRRAKKLAGDA